MKILTEDDVLELGFKFNGTFDLNEFEVKQYRYNKNEGNIFVEFIYKDGQLENVDTEIETNCVRVNKSQLKEMTKILS